MRIKSDFILRGAKPTNVVMDGRTYDNTKIYVDLPISGGKGCMTTEYQWGDSSNYTKHLEHLDYPCDVVVEFEMVMQGKNQRTIIHDVQVKKPVKGA